MSRVSIILLAALTSCSQDPFSQDPPPPPPPAIDCYDISSVQQMHRMMECVNELLNTDGDFRMSTCKWYVLGDGKKSGRQPPTSEINCMDLSYANRDTRLADCDSGVGRPDVELRNKKCRRYVLGAGESTGDPLWYIEHGGWLAAQIAEEIILKQADSEAADE